MAKGSSGGKAGGALYAGKPSGAKYNGSTGYKAKGSSRLYNPIANAMKGAKYDSKYDSSPLSLPYLKNASGIAKVDFARKAGMDFDKGYQSSLGNYGSRMSIGEDESSRCGLCGDPTPPGIAFCIKCVIGMN